MVALGRENLKFGGGQPVTPSAASVDGKFVLKFYIISIFQIETCHIIKA